MAGAASAAPARAIFSWGAPMRRGLWRLWPGEEKHLQLAQLHQDGGHPAGKVLLPIHQPPAAGEALHLSYVSLSDTNLLSVVWFGWQQPQQPQLLRNFMISRFNWSLCLYYLKLSKFTWIHLDLPEFTWIYVNVSKFPWFYLNSSKFT